MSSDRERDALEAQQLLNNQLLNSVLSEIERGAFERGVSAAPTDDEMRAAAMAEVRAVRSFVASLTHMIAVAEQRPKRGIA